MKELSLQQTGTEDPLKVYEGTLSEQAVFLSPLSGAIVSRWSELYLETFGRNAFFPPQRVRKIFQELTGIFIGCLEARSLDVYFENLGERGTHFARLGVPFEEVILSLHLFEETCVEQFLQSYADRSKLARQILAMEELHSRGLTCLAVSYFHAAKAGLERLTDGLQEENRGLREELTKTRDSLFTLTRNELNSMQLLLASVNQKLRSRVYQLGRLQRLFEALGEETDASKLLKLAADQLAALLPAGSGPLFGVFGDDRKIVSLYRQSAHGEECSLERQFYFSELPEAFQAALYDPERRAAHFQDFRHFPRPIAELTGLRSPQEFLLMPLRRYSEVTGFIVLTTPAEGFFTKANYRFFQRAGQVIGKAIVTASLHRAHRQSARLEAFRAEMERPDARESFETALDRCLASLMELTGAERSSLMRLDEHARELRVSVAKGVRVYPIGGLALKWGEGIAGLALKESRPIAIARMAAGAKTPKRGRLSGFFAPKHPSESGLKSLLCVPVGTPGRPLGVINLSTIHFFKDFDSSEIGAACEIAGRMGELLARSE